MVSTTAHRRPSIKRLVLVDGRVIDGHGYSRFSAGEIECHRLISG
jgi:hypothetical protein